MRTRKQRVEHERPQVFKQYRWKPYSKVPEGPSDELAKDNTTQDEQGNAEKACQDPL